MSLIRAYGVSARLSSMQLPPSKTREHHNGLIKNAHDNLNDSYYYTVWTVYKRRSMKAESTRARIRVAAARVIERDGAAHLTLDKIAAAAGISKGGLLYHYPSKQALLEGLLTHLLGNRPNLIEPLASDEEQNLTLLLDSLIDADFDLPEDERIMAQGLVAASAESPELLAPAKEHVGDLFAALGTPPPTADAARIIFLASQGLQLLEILGLLSLSAPERNQVRQHLKALTRELQPC